MRYICCLLMVLVWTGCRSARQALSPDRRGYMQEILLEGPTLLTPLYDDYSPENYRASKIDVVQGLPEAAEALDKELLATLVIGPGGALWDYNILAFLREDGYIAVRQMQVPHARITWKGSGSMSEQEFATWWQRLVSHNAVREGLWSADASPQPALLIGHYTPEGIRYLHADFRAEDTIDDQGTPHPDSVLAHINSVVEQVTMTYSQQVEQDEENLERDLWPNSSHTATTIITLDAMWYIGYAAKLNCLDTIRAQLDKGVTLDRPQSSTGRTVLHVAAEAGHADLCRWLIEQGAPLNAQGKNGETALMLAAQAARIECARVLLVAGAEPNLEDKEGNTAFTIAIRHKRYQIARLLHEHGADINHQNAVGDSALHLGAPWDKRQRVKLLLAMGANPSLQNEEGYTPLCIVLDYILSQVLARMLMAAGATLQTEPRERLVHVMETLVNAEAWELLRELLEPYPTFFRDHPYASNFNAADHLVEFLEIAFDHGLVPANTEVGSLLIAAVEHPEALEMLLARGANPNARDEDGNTALHGAIRERQLPVIERLLQEDLDPDLQSLWRETPLYLAIEEGLTEVALKLLEKGADPYQPNRGGLTAMGRAIAYNQQAVVAAATKIPRSQYLAGDRVLTVLVDPADSFNVYLLRGDQFIFPREQEAGRWIFRELAPDTYRVRVNVPSDMRDTGRVAEQAVVVSKPEQTVRIKAPGGKVDLSLRSRDGSQLGRPYVEFATLRQRNGDLVRRVRLESRDNAWYGKVEYILPGTYSIWVRSRYHVKDVTISEDDYDTTIETTIRMR